MPSAPSTPMWVSTSSSVIGSSRTPGCQRSQSRAVISARPTPSCSSLVRIRCVARSRSPSPNQVSSPYAPSSSLAFHVSSVRPQRRSGSMPLPRVYMTVSRSGHTRMPNSQMSSAVLPMTVISSSGAFAARRPWRNLAPPTPPDSTVIFMDPFCPEARELSRWPGRTSGRRRSCSCSVATGISARTANASADSVSPPVGPELVGADDHAAIVVDDELDQAFVADRVEPAATARRDLGRCPRER